MTMTRTLEQRTPVLRKRATKEELASLHPVERGLYRVFEAFASIKLAIVLMLWLIVACVIGTFIESQVNAGAAKYFIYGHWSFAILFALLALNILCAALIRFPWKRYQTGFVVTHAGLLLLIVGSMVTSRGNIDALLTVAQGETKSTYFDSESSVLFVGSRGADGSVQRSEVIPVDFGPFTWGHRIFGRFPWRKGHTEEYRFKNGGVLTVEKFYAHSDAERIYSPHPAGPPAVEYRLYHPQRADRTQWLAADAQTQTGSARLGPGELVIWRVETEEELDHFLHAVPKPEQPMGLLGLVGYSHGGKHHLFSVDALKKSPQPIPGTDAKLEWIEYLPSARLDARRQWVSKGDEPDNPLLRLKLVQGDKAEEYIAFGAHPEYATLLVQKFGREHLFSYFPASPTAVVHLAVAPDGRMGYRAFGSQGLLASTIAEEGKEYPCWADLRFVPKKILGGARPDLKVTPRPIPPGKPTQPAILVEYREGSEKFSAKLVRGRPILQRVGDKQIVLGYDLAEAELPFQVRLDEFEEPKNPGTNQPAMYTSTVTLFDKKRDLEKVVDITMNEPLRYEGTDGIEYTLYQSGIDWSTGTPISTYTVGYDPGLWIKYLGAIVLCTGIFLMFYMGGYFKGGSRTAKAARA